MTSFWNRPVWYVAVLRCVVGGIVGTAGLFAGASVIPALGEMIMRLAGPDQGAEVLPDPFGAFLVIPYLLIFIAGCVLFAIRCAKWSAAIAYRGQGRVRFVPKYVLILLLAYLSWRLAGDSGMGDTVYFWWVDALSLNWREQEGLDGAMFMYFLGYLPTYVISLLVYHYVELAREAPVEET